MKSILLTGATGFIGRHTILPLLEKGYTVHGVYTNQIIPEMTQVIWHKVDLHDQQAVKNLLEEIKPFYLLHLAWYVKPNEFWISPKNIDWLTSSLYLFEEFIKAGGKRAVLAGTISEYDESYGHCRENVTPCAPLTLYGRVKYALNLLTDSIAKQNNISLAWARLFPMFGCYEYPERLIPSLMNTLLKKNLFNVMNGQFIRDFMYVKETGDALVALLDSEVTGSVNIASGNPVKIQDIVAYVGNKLNKNELIHYHDGLNNYSQVTADVTRLFREVKWQPKYSLNSALDETIAWWSDRSV